MGGLRSPTNSQRLGNTDVHIKERERERQKKKVIKIDTFYDRCIEMGLVNLNLVFVHLNPFIIEFPTRQNILNWHLR